MMVILGEIPNSWQAPERKSGCGQSREMLITFQRRELCSGGSQRNGLFT